MSASDTRARISSLLAGPVEELGLDLEGVDLSTAGKRRVLRVAVDQDGGVSMDDIAEATRVVSRALDESDVLGDRPYTLEVSSPGVDRPLTHPRHWRRNAGRLVRATLGEETVTGRVTESDEESATLDLGPSAGAERLRRVPLSEVTRATVQIEFTKREGTG